MRVSCLSFQFYHGSLMWLPSAMASCRDHNCLPSSIDSSLLALVYTPGYTVWIYSLLNTATSAAHAVVAVYREAGVPAPCANRHLGDIQQALVEFGELAVGKCDNVRDSCHTDCLIGDTCSFCAIEAPYIVPVHRLRSVILRVINLSRRAFKSRFQHWFW
jgi:hypothetical protein